MERNSFMDATSPKDERFETLKQLYPELIRDNKLNLEALKDLFDEESFDEGEVGYNLYWPGKRDAKKLARKEAEGTLEPVIGDGVNEDKTSNIYIEGDNLEVLRCLKKSYGGRVKMIYIDPPYNTGKDFIYPDNFAEPIEDYLKFTGQVDEKGVSLVANPKSSGAYHRRWLDMMLPRLHLARELLANEGVIFISIDDNEQANLKLLCDEVFGEENFVGELIHQRAKGGGQAKYIVKGHDYILCYGKKIENVSLTRKKVIQQKTIEIDGETYIKNDDVIRKQFGKYDKSLGDRRCFYEELLKYKGESKKKEVDELIKKGVYFLEPNNEGMHTICEYIKVDDAKSKLYSIIKVLSEKGKEDIENLGINGFSYPKPVEIVKQLVEAGSSEKDSPIIIDFFSGSATTAQSVMELNAENLRNCRYIMVQLPVVLDEKEKDDKIAIDFLDSIHKPHTICEIGKERIRRAGKKILEEHPELKGKLDVGFKVYRLAKSNISSYKPTTGSDQQSLLSALDAMEKQVTPLRDGFDMNNPNDVQGLLVEIILRQGFALDSNIEKATSLAGNTIYRIVDKGRPIVLHVCLDEKIKAETVKNIAFEENDKFICLNKAITDELYAQLSDKGRVETI